MQNLSFRVRSILAYQPVPLQRKRADFLVCRPLKSMQLQAGCCVDIFWCQRQTSGIVENHHARPVLSRINCLDMIQELHAFGRRVVMLAAMHGFTIVRRRVWKKLCYVRQTKHVAIHEDRESLIAGQVRHQESSHAELSGFERATHPSVDILNTLQSERNNLDRNRGPSKDRTCQNGESNRLFRVVAYEDFDAFGPTTTYNSGPFWIILPISKNSFSFGSHQSCPF